MATNNNDEYTLLNQTFDQLWPITRSITGPGLEESLSILNQHMPLQIETVSTGSKVFDWTVPKEWHFKRAVLTGPNNEVICDSNEHNLHVVNYSQAVNKQLSLDELQPHLHSLPNLPTAIPYVTSYYQENWGFCLSEHQREQLKPGTYQANIEAEFVDGGVSFAHCTLPGESKREILLSSYICHPSMANNELSGPLVLLALYNRIKRWPKRRYTYRFLLNPETIGSLCFLSRYAQHLKQNLEAGAVLTCIGGPANHIHFKASCLGNSLFDKVGQACLNKEISLGAPLLFDPYCPTGGSDERQYGAPGFRLPVSQIARTRYDNFDAYHNSLDTKEFMGIDNLIKSTNSLERFLQYVEVCGKPVNQSPYGEPQLGPRGLYPNINAASTRSDSSDAQIDGRVVLNRILNTLNMADGHNDLFSIANTCNCTIDELIPTIEQLEANNLIKYGEPPL